LKSRAEETMALKGLRIFGSLAYFNCILLYIGFADFLRCYFLYRDGSENTKCPVAVADLVAMHNGCMEGLYGTKHKDPLPFDFFQPLPQLKTSVTRYCKPFDKLLCSSASTYRVSPVNEERSTILDITGFVTAFDFECADDQEGPGSRRGRPRQPCL
jgi:hypothetical protein